MTTDTDLAPEDAVVAEHVNVTDQVTPLRPVDEAVRTGEHFAWIDVRALSGAARDAVVAAASVGFYITAPRFFPKETQL